MSPRSDIWCRPVLWFSLALALQLAVIGGMVATQRFTATNGKAVYLKIEPVDPRDPLRGDFLSFTYSISRLSPDMVTNQETQRNWTPKAGQTVYVPLVQQGGVWDVMPGVAPALPTVGPNSPYSSDTVFIRGGVESVSATQIVVKYGIEEYFVPEGKAAQFPVDRGAKLDAKARVIVGPDGRGQLQQVLLDGRPWP